MPTPASRASSTATAAIRSSGRIGSPVGSTAHVASSTTPVPVLSEGSTGPAVRSLQEMLTSGAPGLWEVTPQGVDGDFGPNTTASVKAFQTWARLEADGIVGQKAWDAASAPEFVVGLDHTVSG